MNIIIKDLSAVIEICRDYSEGTEEGHLSQTEESKDLPVNSHLRTESIFIPCHIPSAVRLFT